IAARGQDRISVNNSIELVRSVLAVQQRDLARTTRDYAWWDEAYANLAAKPDAGWANENIGSYVKDSFGVSGSFVVDEKVATVFAFIGGQAASYDLRHHAAGGLDQLIEEARRSPVANPEPASGLITIDGEPQIAAVNVIIPGPVAAPGLLQQLAQRTPSVL